MPAPHGWRPRISVWGLGPARALAQHRGPGAAPVHGVLPRAPTGKPASSLNGTLCSGFFFFSPPRLNFCSQLRGSLPPLLPAAAKPQTNCGAVWRCSRGLPRPPSCGRAAESAGFDHPEVAPQMFKAEMGHTGRSQTCIWSRGRGALQQALQFCCLT